MTKSSNNGFAKLALAIGERDHVQGTPDAPVTLVQYGDYTNPACRRAYPAVLHIQKWLSGLLRFAYRHFTFPGDETARRGAEAAEAAAAQNNFWAMHERLLTFEPIFDESIFVRHAAAINLDSARFAAELASRQHFARVQEDYQSAIKSGVSMSPAFFINNMKYTGSNDVFALLAAIEEAGVKRESDEDD